MTTTAGLPAATAKAGTFSHDAAGSDDSSVADLNSFQNNGPGSNPGAMANSYGCSANFLPLSSLQRSSEIARACIQINRMAIVIKDLHSMGDERFRTDLDGRRRAKQAVVADVDALSQNDAPITEGFHAKKSAANRVFIHRDPILITSAVDAPRIGTEKAARGNLRLSCKLSPGPPSLAGSRRLKVQPPADVPMVSPTSGKGMISVNRHEQKDVDGATMRGIGGWRAPTEYPASQDGPRVDRDFPASSEQNRKAAE